MAHEDRFRKCCAGCAFWDDLERSEGLCRAATPRSHVVGGDDGDLVIRAIWPRTAGDDWCGHWRGRRRPESYEAARFRQKEERRSQSTGPSGRAR